MLERLLATLRGIWQRQNAPVEAAQEGRDPQSARSEAQRRFWTELQEGQREAEDRCARSEA